MKKTNLFIIVAISLLTLFLLCSCSRGSVTRAGDSMRNAARRTENFIDSGLNAVENGVENGMGTVVGGMYGANSGYSGNAGIGTTTGANYARGGNATNLLPTINERNHTNKGMINTNRGSLDGGMGSGNNSSASSNSKKR